MKIIIPMAGKGSRLRPHTLTLPKPLFPIAGKPMVQRLVEDLAASLPEKIEEIAFVIGDFGKETEKRLAEIAAEIGASCSIYYQDVPLGPGHAILCAKRSITGKCLVAFSDTLFKADFSFDPEEDGIIWVQKVKDPASFGVVKLDENNYITDFVEKSPVFVSDLAIVGLYYIKDGDQLRDTLQYLVDNNIRDKGEFQITTALEHLKKEGKNFRSAPIEEWLDCGNARNVLNTNRRMLELKADLEQLVSDSVKTNNAVIIPPSYIGKNVKIENAVIGPYVSIGDNSSIYNSVINNTIIQNDTAIKNANFTFSLIGSKVDYQGKSSELSLGDYTKM